MDNPMNTSHRLLLGGAAVLTGFGGHSLSNKIFKNAHKEFGRTTFSWTPRGQAYKDAANNYELKSGLSTLIRFTSFTASSLLARYAYSGYAPAQNTQTTISAVTIAAAGVMYGISAAKKNMYLHYNSGEKIPFGYRALMMSGAGLGLLGLYGLHRNQ